MYFITVVNQLPALLWSFQCLQSPINTAQPQRLNANIVPHQIKKLAAFVFNGPHLITYIICCDSLLDS